MILCFRVLELSIFSIFTWLRNIQLFLIEQSIVSHDIGSEANKYFAILSGISKVIVYNFLKPDTRMSCMKVTRQYNFASFTNCDIILSDYFFYVNCDITLSCTGNWSISFIILLDTWI